MGVLIEAFQVSGAAEGSGSLKKLSERETNTDGRTDSPLLEGEAFKAGVYELHFHVGPYLAASGRAQPDPKFLDTVVIRFGVASANEHYHVPLLLQACGYSTYRGS